MILCKKKKDFIWTYVENLLEGYQTKENTGVFGLWVIGKSENV